jgi:hypothetical protein
MRYVITNAEGGSPSYFDSREAARASLLAFDEHVAGSANNFLLWTYDDDGKRRGTPEWAEEILSIPLAPVASFASLSGGGERRPMRRGKIVGVAAGLSLVCPAPVLAASSERAPSNVSGPRQHSIAKHTPGHAGGDGAAG